MTEYKCNICDYTTTRTDNFTRHNLSKHHKDKCILTEKNMAIRENNYIIEIEKLKLQLTCRDTEIEKLKLQNACIETKLISLEKELATKDVIIKKDEAHKTEVTKLQGDRITDLKDIMCDLKNDKQHYKSIVTTVNANNAQSMSTINFLTAHRNSAPPLKELTEQTAKLCIEYDNDDLVHLCISHQRHNSLHTFIGNIIAECYKTADPKDQSIWNSDVSRLTFIIRDKVKDMNVITKGKTTKYVDKWIQDKKGVKVNKKIITPILKFLRDTLDKYSITHSKSIRVLIMTNPFKYAEEAEKIGYANKIISTIASGKLGKRISTHLGAQFQLDNKEIIPNKSDDGMLYISKDNDSSDYDSSNDSDSSSDGNLSCESDYDDDSNTIIPRKILINKK
jgi:hypothetical protein